MLLERYISAFQIDLNEIEAIRRRYTLNAMHNEILR